MTCESCGKALRTQGRGRPQTKYCSSKCKDDARTAANRRLVAAKLAARRCANCEGPLPGGAGGKARTCSRECGVAWQNSKRAAKRRAEWEASNPRCQHCESPIPESRRAGVKFCSTDCKKATTDARWREKSPGYMRRYLYGLTDEQYEALLTRQDGRCAICKTNEWSGHHKKPHVDHDHATGRVRGILCNNCNQGLGRFADDPVRLMAAARYLS